ncbi:MAG: cation:proton antiporter [Pseudomonadales bacterium]|nr:cation:proton antiporter [Pseudomonadales bacterium]
MELVHLDALVIALIGVSVLVSVLINSVAERLGLPALVGYLVFGAALRWADDSLHFLSEHLFNAFRVLADLGIVALLFEIGLASNPRALAAKLPQASVIWLVEVLVAGGAAYFLCHYALHFSEVTSLVAAAALSGTSVGVCAVVWENAGRLNSPEGELLIDVAELDDLSAVGLMAILFALAPVLLSGNGDAGSALLGASAGFVASLGLLILVAVIFARFLEHPLTRFAGRLRRPPERMLMVAGVGFVIAAFAAWLGFSLAIGAMLAGLLFSRDPAATRTERSFRDISAFVTPFFFIYIGLCMDPASIGGSLPIGGLLLVVAMLSKLVGNGLPAWVSMNAPCALLIGVSMMPRAEITMVVMDQARLLFPEAISGELYSAMVLVTAATCLVSPLLLAPMLRATR